MGSPDFKKRETYYITIKDSKGTNVYIGIVNDKSWHKSIENGVLWEFLPKNSRVLEKILPGLVPDFENAEIKDDRIIVPAYDAFDVKSGKSSKNPAPDKVTKSGTDRSYIEETSILTELERIIKLRKLEMPENSYTTQLFSKGTDKILKKFGEESIELILAKGNEKETVYEAADVLYHLMVYFVHLGIDFDSILKELQQRMIKK